MIPFCLDEWADAHDCVHVVALDQLEELDHVVPAFEIVLAGLGLVGVPEDVGLDGVEAAVLGGLEQLVPHVGGAARVVDGAGEEEVPPAVDQEGALVVGDDARLLRQGPLGRLRRAREERGGDRQKERRGGGHVSQRSGGGLLECGNWEVGVATLARGLGRRAPL